VIFIAMEFDINFWLKEKINEQIDSDLVLSPVARPYPEQN